MFLEEPFRAGVLERIEDGKLSACKVTFGPEPKEYEVGDHVPRHRYELVFSPVNGIKNQTVGNAVLSGQIEHSSAGCAEPGS